MFLKLGALQLGRPEPIDRTAISHHIADSQGVHSVESPFVMRCTTRLDLTQNLILAMINGSLAKCTTQALTVRSGRRRSRIRSFLVSETSLEIENHFEIGVKTMHHHFFQCTTRWTVVTARRSGDCAWNCFGLACLGPLFDFILCAVELLWVTCDASVSGDRGCVHGTSRSQLGGG